MEVREGVGCSSRVPGTSTGHLGVDLGHLEALHHLRLLIWCVWRLVSWFLLCLVVTWNMCEVSCGLIRLRTRMSAFPLLTLGNVETLISCQLQQLPRACPSDTGSFSNINGYRRPMFHCYVTSSCAGAAPRRRPFAPLQVQPPGGASSLTFDDTVLCSRFDTI